MFFLEVNESVYYFVFGLELRNGIKIIRYIVFFGIFYVLGIGKELRCIFCIEGIVFLLFVYV